MYTNVRPAYMYKYAKVQFYSVYIRGTCMRTSASIVSPGAVSRRTRFNGCAWIMYAGRKN